MTDKTPDELDAERVAKVTAHQSTLGSLSAQELSSEDRVRLRMSTAAIARAIVGAQATLDRMREVLEYAGSANDIDVVRTQLPGATQQVNLAASAAGDLQVLMLELRHRGVMYGEMRTVIRQAVDGVQR